MSNLLNNAAKYTENGGQIWLTADQRGQDIVIPVRDTGIGIAPEKLPQMFELFAQGDRSLARSEGGLGIGLDPGPLARRDARRDVSATSEGPGQGSEFTVRLPATAKPEARAGEAKGEAAGDGIVASWSSTTTWTWPGAWPGSSSSSGTRFTMAHDGPTGLEAARSFRPEFVLLDIGLPGMDGYEVARQLRAEDCGGRCPDHFRHRLRA